MSISNALQLYAQFLKEFPAKSREDDVKLQVLVGTDGMLIFLVRLRSKSAGPDRYPGSVFNRVNHWFASRHQLVLERADRNRSNNVLGALECFVSSLRERTTEAFWAFSVLIPVEQPNGQQRYEYF